MNKNMKKIIAIALAFGSISAVAPATNVNFLTTKVYASDNQKDKFDSLELKTSGGSTIRLYDHSDCSSDSKVDSDDVSEGNTYYAKTSSDTVNIDTSGVSSSYVKIFKGTSNSTKGKSKSSDISLSSGTTTLTVKIYDKAPDSDVRYDNNNEDADVIGTYTIKVKHIGDSSNSEGTTADDYDSIYLNKLSVDGDSISLSNSNINYTYNVANNVEQVTVKAVPEDTDNDTITIDGKTVDDSDNYKKTISLDKGENKIKIETNNSDDDKNRVYTLNIIRASTATVATAATAATATNVVTTTAKTNQWVQQASGTWQYNDATGNPIKNNWFSDKTTGKEYYLKADGSMATGWQPIGGIWYYLGTDGAKKIGWQSVDGNWYYLDTVEGKMQTGWIVDNGKYYYLNSNGSMAYNTTIQGYKLGANGAWAK